MYRPVLKVGPQKTSAFFDLSAWGYDTGLSDGDVMAVVDTDGNPCPWLSARVTSDGPSDGYTYLEVVAESYGMTGGDRTSGAMYFFGPGVAASGAKLVIENVYQAGTATSGYLCATTMFAGLSESTPQTRFSVMTYGSSSGLTTFVDPGANGTEEMFASAGAIAQEIYPTMFPGYTETDDTIVVQEAVSESVSDGTVGLGAIRIYIPAGVEPVDSGAINVSPDSLTFTASSGMETASIGAHSSWVATGYPSDVTVFPSSGSGDAMVSVIVPANTDTGSIRNFNIVFRNEYGNESTLSVSQAAATSSAVVPGGNGASGGTAANPTIQVPGNVIYRGSDGVFAADASVNGSVDSQGGESWKVTLAMRSTALSGFLESRGLFVGSTWAPVEIPSRNQPLLAGWHIVTRKGVATVELTYSIEAGAAYSYGTNVPAETEKWSVSHSTVERPLSECPAIFGSADPAESAVVIEWCKKYIQATSPSVAGDDSAQALEDFFAALLEQTGKSESEFNSSASVAKVLACLRAGQDSFLAHTSTINYSEVRNIKPVGIGEAVGTYQTPATDLATGDKWLLVADDVEKQSNGQWSRNRQWQKAEIQSPTYK